MLEGWMPTLSSEFSSPTIPLHHPRSSFSWFATRCVFTRRTRLSLFVNNEELTPAGGVAPGTYSRGACRRINPHVNCGMMWGRGLAEHVQGEIRLSGSSAPRGSCIHRFDRQYGFFDVWCSSFSGYRYEKLYELGHSSWRGIYHRGRNWIVKEGSYQKPRTKRCDADKLAWCKSHYN